MKGIYIHIPFCKKKCNYCNFTSFDNLNLIDEYVENIIKEMKMYKNDLIKYKKGIKTIYIGGGTPSILSEKSIIGIVEKLYKYIDRDKIEEFTIEVNPESVTDNLLKVYYNLGINRISMGIQTTDDDFLAVLGRMHNFDKAKESFYKIRNAGFKNINLDLIYSLPNQTEKDIVDDLKNIVFLNPEHISTYSLSYEVGTKLNKLFEDGKIKKIDDDIDRDNFKSIKDYLKNKNYLRYEISNFSKKGYESKHNLLYWSGCEYFAFGLGAHGYINRIRYENSTDFDEYFKFIKENKKPIVYREIIDEKENLFEYIILNLRKVKGFSVYDIDKKFNINFLKQYRVELKELLKNETIVIENRRVRLTEYGFDVSNQVFLKFR